MRILLVSAALALSASAAFAQATPPQPARPAPSSAAPFEQREDWCQKYAAWFVARTPVDGPRPTDVRETQRFENELNYCKLDPQEYERQTTAELSRVTESGAG